MYIIDETYFQAPKKEVPNLDEADSRAFAELERIIDDLGRSFMYYFLTPEEVAEFNTYLVNGKFPSDVTGIPQKWVDLVNGKMYTVNDVDLVWNGLLFTKGTYKGSVLADYVYHNWLETQASYMTGVGDAKANPKGANLVNPTQRVVKAWNDFVEMYQDNLPSYRGSLYGNYYPLYPYNGGVGYWQYYSNKEVSLTQFLSDNQTDYTSENRKFFEVKNQLGL